MSSSSSIACKAIARKTCFGRPRRFVVKNACAAGENGQRKKEKNATKRALVQSLKAISNQSSHEERRSDVDLHRDRALRDDSEEDDDDDDDFVLARKKSTQTRTRTSFAQARKPSARKKERENALQQGVMIKSQDEEERTTNDMKETFASRYSSTTTTSQISRFGGRRYSRSASIDEELYATAQFSSSSSENNNKNKNNKNINNEYNRQGGGSTAAAGTSGRNNSFRQSSSSSKVGDLEGYNRLLDAFDSVNNVNNNNNNSSNNSLSSSQSSEDDDSEEDENVAMKAANSIDKFGGSDAFESVDDGESGANLSVGQCWARLELAADTGNAPKALEALDKILEIGCAQPLRAYNSALRACKRARPPAYRSTTILLQRMREDASNIKPDQRTYHEVIAAYARAHEWRLAERTFEEMKRDPNVGWKEMLEQIKASAIAAATESTSNEDIEYSNGTYSSSRQQRGSSGRRTFSRASKTDDPVQDVVRVYTSLISAYGKGGKWERSLNAFQELMDTPGCYCDTGSHNALLSAAVNAAKYPEAAQLFSSMQKNSRVHRNVTSYNSLITCYGKQRKIGDMESIFSQMKRNGVRPNETTHAVMIAAHGNTVEDSECKRAIELLTRCVRDQQVLSSAVVFNSALGACAKRGNREAFNLVLRMMREEGIVPTLITYNTRLMEATARRDWREAARTYKELLLDGLLPDCITFDCLCGIEKLVLAREKMEALALEDSSSVSSASIEDYDGGVDAKSVADRDNAHLRSADDSFEDDDENDEDIGNANPMGELPELLRDIIKDNAFIMKLNNKASMTAAYDAYLRVCYADGRFDEVADAFSRMISDKVPRTVHTYNSLLISFEAACKWREAGNAMDLMRKESPLISPDALTFDALIDVCEEMGQWDRATQYLEDAQGKYGYLKCEDELGVLDLHRVRSAGTAQCVLRWWLRRMRQRALAPMDIQSAGKGTRQLLQKGTMKSQQKIDLPVSIRDLPDEIQVVTGWGKHSTVYGRSPVKTRVLATMKALNSPFTVPQTNIGCIVADRGAVRSWLVKEELLSLARFLLGNKDALKRNFNPLSGPNKVTDEDVLAASSIKDHRF